MLDNYQESLIRYLPLENKQWYSNPWILVKKKSVIAEFGMWQRVLSYNGDTDRSNLGQWHLFIAHAVLRQPHYITAPVP